ncbi:MAG: hypothetical protein AB7O52_16500 [Planctomycetota bacterium]
MPACADAADADDGGTLNIADAIWILNFLFASGPPPASPHPLCGVDPTPDGLNSCVYAGACP